MKPKTLPDHIDEHLDNGLFIYLWLLAAIVFTTPVNAEVGRLISRLVWANEGGKFIHGITFAVIIEIGIFILAAIGERKAAKFIMFYSIFAHILFFHMWDEFIELNYGGYLQEGIFIQYTPGTLEYYLKFSLAFVKVLASIGVSIVAPVLIFFFSEKIAQRRREKNLHNDIVSLNNQIAILKQEKADTERDVATHKREQATTKREQAKAERDKATVQEEVSELQNLIATLKQEIKTLNNKKNGMAPKKAKSEEIVLTNQEEQR